MKTKRLVLIALCAALVSCNDQAGDRPASNPSDPKTVFGQSVKKAKAVSGVYDERNKQLDGQKKIVDE